MDSNLEIVIKAVDDASSALAKVSSSLQGMQKQYADTAKAVDGSTSANAKAKSSQDSLAASVTKGIAAYDIMKTSVKAVAGFVEDSIGAYLDASKSTDLTRATIKAMGLDLDTVGPQVDAFGAKMAGMGVDDEAAALAAVKLAKAAGNDIPKGMELAKLASDLASSGFGSLEDNASTLSAVLAGRGTAAIKQYRLNLSDTATTGDILNAIQGKVTQTTEEYAQTVPGRIQTVKTAYDNLKEAVGEGFVTAITDAINQSGIFDDVMGNTGNLMDTVKIIAYELAKAFIAVFQAIVVVGKLIANVVIQFDALAKAMHGDFAGALAESKSGTDGVTDSVKNLGKTMSDMLHPQDAMAAASKRVAVQHVDTSNTIIKAGSGIVNAQKSVGKASEEAAKKAEEAAKSMAEKVKTLQDTYKELSQNATVDLAELEDAHRESMTSINASIASTQKAMADLQKQYNREQVSDTASVADKIVASQDKVADLTAQLAKETDLQKKADLKSQLDAEQKNLDSSADFQRNNAAAISEARRRAGLTDLAREIEDYNSRRALAAQEFADKMNDLTMQLAANQKAAADEMLLYQTRKDTIQAILDQATQDFTAQANSRVKVTEEEVNKEIEYYKALAAAISASKSGSLSAIKSIGAATPIASPIAGKRASGGPVSPYATYLVGENGPEYFTPSTGGTIIPNGGANGGKQITIIFQGNNFTDKKFAEKVGDQIIGELKKNMKL